MMDISDGLAGDLRHILKASGVGAELLKKALPVSREAKAMSRSRRREEADISRASGNPPPHVGGYSPFVAALTDGEDFELLFTLPGKSAVPLLDEWKKKFPKLKLSCIGKIISSDGILICDQHGSHKFSAQGYNHFEK